MDNKWYLACVFVHSHYKTGEYLEAQVMQICNGWIYPELFDELQQELDYGLYFRDLIDDRDDFEFDRSYLVEFQTGHYRIDHDYGSEPIVEFTFRNPRMEPFSELENASQ